MTPLMTWGLAAVGFVVGAIVGLMFAGILGARRTNDLYTAAGAAMKYVTRKMDEHVLNPFDSELIGLMALFEKALEP